jgi:hypothetical protein
MVDQREALIDLYADVWTVEYTEHKLWVIFLEVSALFLFFFVCLVWAEVIDQHLFKLSFVDFFNFVANIFLLLWAAHDDHLFRFELLDWTIFDVRLELIPFLERLNIKPCSAQGLNDGTVHRILDILINPNDPVSAESVRRNLLEQPLWFHLVVDVFEIPVSTLFLKVHLRLQMF